MINSFISFSDVIRNGSKDSTAYKERTFGNSRKNFHGGITMSSMSI